MKKTYMRFTSGANDGKGGAAPDTKKKDGSGAEEKGEDGDDEDSELKAIQRMSDQIDSFKTLLGDKADAEKFEQASKDIATLKEKFEEMTSKQVMTAIESINKQAEGIYKQVLDVLSDLADQKKEQGGSGMVSGPIVNTAEVKAFVDSLFDGNKKRKATDKTITIKAPETFGIGVTFVSGSDATAFTGRYVDPTLNVRKRKKNLILDNFQIQTISVPSLVYLEKVEVGDTNPTSGDPGGADWILPGAAKPKRSFRVKSATAEAKKVAIFATIEDKLLRDVPSFENWIRTDLIEEMREEINNALLNNNPGSNALAPLGLKQNAVQYTVTPAFDETVADPQYIDMIIAAIASMAEDKEDPGMIFVSTDVFYAIHALKASDGRYINNALVYVNSVGQLFIAGVEVIGADSEDIPSTHFLLVANDLGFKIFAYGPMVLESGLNGENFREDKTSFRGYQEFVTYIASNRVNSVMYDTWANVEAAITLADAGS